jgi:hypothetical protein
VGSCRVAVLTVFVVAGVGAGLGACGSDDDSDSTTVASTTAASEPAAGDTSGDPAAGTDPAVEDSGGPSEVAYFDEGDIDPALAEVVELAIGDLAERLDLAEDEIDTHSAVLVVWPDGALGCPQPGMSYTQVLTDGAVIELVAAGEVYRYHSGADSDPFPCAQPLEPLPQRP